MKLQYHIAISAPVSLGLYLYFKSLAAAVGCFMAGVFVDLDHLPDYLVYCGFKLTGLKEFFQACHSIKLSKLYLVLHSYEIIPILILIGHYTNWNNLTVGIFTGFVLHLTLDQFSNRMKYACRPLFYFFTYRLIKGFRKELLVNRPDGMTNG